MKDKRLNFRVTEETDRLIRDKASQAGMSITDYVIASCTQRAVVNFDGVRELTTQVKRLGNNVNQLLILARQGRINVVDLSGTTEELSRIHEELSAVLRRRR